MILFFAIAALIALAVFVPMILAVGPSHRRWRGRLIASTFKPKAAVCRCCSADVPPGWPSDLCAACLRIWEQSHLPREAWHLSSSAQWFMGHQGRRLGPYRFASLRQLAERGKLKPNHLVWTEGMAGWKRADAIEGLLLPTAAGSLPTAVRAASSRAAASATAAPAALAPAARSARPNYRVNWLLTQTVGLWRSVAQYVWHGKSGWAAVAKICVALGLLRLAGWGLEQIPMMQQSLGLTTKGYPMRASELHVLNQGTEVEIAGGMSVGTTDALKTILEATPTIDTVRLEDAGGWISEGDRVGKLIEARALSTFTARECDSACLLAFLRGKERYLGSRGRLGFHGASVTAVGGDAAQKGNELFRQAFLARGIPNSFIDRALSTPATDVWYPTAQELLQAHVITAVVDEREHATIGFNTARAKLEADFVAVPVFAVLRRLEPDTFESLKSTYVSGVLAGTPQNEMSAKLHATIMTKVIPKYVRIAPDDELVAYWQTQVEKARELRAIDPKYCVEFLTPQAGTDTSKLVSLFSAKAQAADIQALANLMNAGAKHPQIVPPGAAVQGALRESARRTEQLMPGAVRIVANPGTAASNPIGFCTAEVTFYESVLALPANRAGPLLRFLVGQG